MNKKIKVLLIIHQLDIGGSQKVILNLAQNLNSERYVIVLLVINKIGEFSDFTHPNVKIIDLKAKMIRYSILKIINVVNIEKPDIIFSGLSFLSLIFTFLIPHFKRKNNMKFIARETNTLSISNASLSYVKLRNFIYKKLYNRFDLIVCQSRYMKEDLLLNYNISELKSVVINNPVDMTQIKAKTLNIPENIYAKNCINLLAIGRLHPNKGFDRLLKILSMLDDKYHLTILGKGQEEENLKALTQELKLSHRVHFLGFKSNPYIYMKQADLFVLSSRHEGFPNVVLEANACGTPVVAFEAPGVSNEVISDGINGYLVKNNDIDEMKSKIIYSTERVWDKEKIKAYIYERFRSEKIILKYEESFETILETNAN